MDEINELIAVLSRKRLKESLIFPLATEGDKRVELYRLLKAEPALSDEQACQRVLGDLNDKAKYFALKAQLKALLLSTVLRFEPSSTTPEPTEALYNCITKFAQAEVLRTYGATSIARSLFEQVLHLAEEFHITHYHLLSLHELNAMASLASDESAFRLYNAEFAHINRQWMAELDAEQIHANFASFFSRTVRTIKPDEPKLVNMLNKMADLHAEYPGSLRITMNNYRMKAYAAQAFRRFREAEQHCQEALKFMTKYAKLFKSSSFGEFYYIGLQCAFAERRYTDALTYAEKAEQSFESKGRYNHLIVLLSKASLYIHSGDFQHAAEICNDVFSSGNLNGLDEMKKESWMVMRALLIFSTLTELGQLHPRTRANLMKDFNVSTFLTTLPVYAADKQGGNIVIQIIQVLLHLGQGNIEGARSRAEALRQYRLSHVAAQEHPRAQIMFKLLSALIKSDFDTEYVQRKYEDLVKRLHSRDPHDVCAYLEGFEIMPYDMVWDHCVQYIEHLQSTNRLLRPLKRNRREV